MRIAKITFLGAVGSLLLVGAGCSLISGSGQSAAVGDGGVFKSQDRGGSWLQKTAVASTTGRTNLNNVSVVTLSVDPSDPSTLYLGTAENGLLYSTDAAETWLQIKDLARGRINAVAVDPKNKCVVYAAIDNKVVKTTDCTRSWVSAYVDSRSDKQVMALAVDFFNPQVVWLTNTAGDVIKSVDAGASWANIKTFNDLALKITLDPSDSRKLYVALRRGGLWRSLDQGATWKDLSLGYQNADGAKEFADLSVSSVAPGTLIFASKYGLLRSTDSGDSWSPLQLLTAPGTTSLTTVAFDPKDAKTVYYATTTTIYRSSDNGVTWVTKNLPTSRAALNILIDKSNPSTLYLGVAKIKK